MTLLALWKPYGVVSRFTPEAGHAGLRDFVPVRDVYPIGRLDADSEGLLLLATTARSRTRSPIRATRIRAPTGCRSSASRTPGARGARARRRGAGSPHAAGARGACARAALPPRPCRSASARRADGVDRADAHRGAQPPGAPHDGRGGTSDAAPRARRDRPLRLENSVSRRASGARCRLRRERAARPPRIAQRRDAARERVLRKQRHDEVSARRAVRVARVEIEEVAGLHEHAAIEQRRRERFLVAFARTRTIADQPASHGSGAATLPASSVRELRAVRGDARANRVLDRRRARRAVAGARARASGDTERNASAMNSSRASASSRAAAGPATTIHATLSCGSASTFDAPESTKCSGPSSAPASAPGGAASRRRVVREDLVRRRSRGRVRARSLRSDAQSSGSTNEPVGLCGSIASSARLRGPSVAASASRSMRQRAPRRGGRSG